MSNIVTPKFRASFPALFEAKLNDMNGKNEYSVVALFEKGADLSPLKKAAEAAIVEKWGADKKKWPPKLKVPFRDQAEKAKEGVLPEGHTAGATFMTFKSSNKPGLVDQNRQTILDSEAVYPGCWLRASVRAYAYEVKGNAGVAFGLQNIQKVGEGDPLSGRVKAEDEFTAVETNDASATDIFN